MFRQRQKLRLMPSSSVALPATKYLDDGSSESSFITGHEALPSFENYKLQTLLKAGVPLEKVNTICIDSGEVDLSSVAKPSKTTEVKSAETKLTETKSAEASAEAKFKEKQ